MSGKVYIVMNGPPGSGKTKLSEYIKLLYPDKIVKYIDQDIYGGNLKKFYTECKKLFNSNADIIINGKTNIDIEARKNIPLPDNKKWTVVGINMIPPSESELVSRITNRKTFSTVSVNTHTSEQILKIVRYFLNRYQDISLNEKQFDLIINLAPEISVMLKSIIIKKKLQPMTGM
jgi:hypothetical protein